MWLDNDDIFLNGNDLIAISLSEDDDGCAILQYYLKDGHRISRNYEIYNEGERKYEKIKAQIIPPSPFVKKPCC